MSPRRLPAEVYWRRRFLVLAAALALVWGGVTLWPAGGESEEDTPRATTSPTDPPSASAEPSATAEPSPADQDAAVATPEDTTVSLRTQAQSCDPEAIRMSPQVPPDQTTKEKVRIQLVISTTASEPCTFTPKAGDLAAIVSAGDAAVWDSEVCGSTALLKGSVALVPQWSTIATATWSGRGSGPACAKDEGWATPGRYALRIGTLGGEPGKTTFRLTEPKKEKPKPEESEDPADPEAEAEDEEAAADS